METITITFGDVAENHVGMEKIGRMAEHGLSIAQLRDVKRKFEDVGCVCELTDLNIVSDVEPAAVLVIRGGLDAFVSSHGLFDALRELNWDKFAKMYGLVKNKTARYNLTFADGASEPNYNEGRGRVYAFQSIPQLESLRERLLSMLPVEALVAEGNYYYDVQKTGIGFHGDTERRVVVGVRLGATIPLVLRWFHQGQPVSPPIVIHLGHGDMYVLSEKAVGTDWKKKTVRTLRHAAGAAKYTKSYP